MSDEAKTCFAHCHMTAAEYGLYSLGKELSYKTRILFFDGRKMGARFRGKAKNGTVGKNAMYRLMHSLIEKGWFEVITPAVRKSTGQWTAHTLRVLLHHEWAEKYGSEHCTPVPGTGTGEDSPVPTPGCASPENELCQSRFPHEPVPQTGHKSVTHSSVEENICKEEIDANTLAYASPENGNGSKSASCFSTAEEVLTQTEAMEHQMCPASPENGNGKNPLVPFTGQGKPVRRTRAQLESLATTTRTTVDALLTCGKFELAA